MSAGLPALVMALLALCASAGPEPDLSLPLELVARRLQEADDNATSTSEAPTGTTTTEEPTETSAGAGASTTEPADANETADAPPVVEFIGRAPKLRIYPGGKQGANDTWIMLTFGKIQELDGQGRRVGGRSIRSLASERGVLWSQEVREIGGAEATVTRMELPLEYRGDFSESCSKSGGGRGGRDGPDDGRDDDKDKKRDGGRDGGSDDSLGSETEEEAVSGGGGSNIDLGNLAGGGRRLQSPGSIAIEIFVFNSDAVVDYGNYSIPVPKGQLKFNIESSTWPFCGADHSLEVNLDLKVPGDRPPERLRDREDDEEGHEGESEAGEGQANSTDAASGEGDRRLGRREDDRKGGDRKSERRGRRPPGGKRLRQSAGKRAVDFDLPTLVMVDDAAAESEIEVSARGGKTSIVFRFPFFEDTLYYDPTLGFGSEVEDPPAAESLTVKRSVVSGSVSLEVAEPAAFCGNAAVLEGMKEAFKQASGAEEAEVELTCDVLARRRLGGRARRLAGSVVVDYTITLSSAAVVAGEEVEAPDASATVAALGAITPEALSALIEEKLSASGVQASVTVTSIAPPTVEVVTAQVVSTTSRKPLDSASTHELPTRWLVVAACALLPALAVTI